MSRFADPSIVSHYQFSRSAASTSRPQSGVPTKDIGLDRRSSSSPSPAKQLTRHQVRMATASLVTSPPFLYPRSSTPERTLSPERPPSASRGLRLSRPMSVRLKPATLSIPASASIEEVSYQSFPKQSHERRMTAHDKKRKKQQLMSFSDKNAEAETWLRLRRSLVELKRLATTQDILLDPCTALFQGDGLTYTTVKHVNREFNRPGLTTSQSTFSRPTSAKRPTETYSRLIFEPLVVASKPIHSGVDKTVPPVVKPRVKPPATAPPRSRLSVVSTRTFEDKRPELIVTDHSHDDVRSLPPTPPPPAVVKAESERPPRKIVTPTSTRTRTPSTVPLTSTIKLKTPVPRCRSATESKASISISKNYPRFIVVADEEHRIESWYHQYPFVLSDDVLSSFESKPSAQRLTISAYFIDDLQTSNPNVSAKTFLQGKPFHLGNDWKKYDLILVSNHVYEQVMNYLTTIINLIQATGRMIKVHQVHHDEDLKKQVKSICKQVQQEHV